jgi:hypothetical protein
MLAMRCYSFNTMYITAHWVADLTTAERGGVRKVNFTRLKK